MPPIGYPGNSVSKAARAKSGGGFESAIEVAAGLSIAGTIAHGSEVTLNDSELRLGARSNTAFRHWQKGGEIYVNGTESTAEVGASAPDTTEVWGSISGTVSISSSDLRHSRIDQQYTVTADGSLLLPKGFDGIGDERKFYLAKWVKPGAGYRLCRIFAYTNLSGIFNSPVQGQRGETITISGSQGTASAYVLHVSGTAMTVEPIGGSLDEAFLTGATVTGDESGAQLTVDIPSGYSGPSAGKPLRVYTGESATDWGTKYVPTYNTTNLDGYDSSNSEVFRFDDPWEMYSSEANVWRLLEIEIDFSGETGTVTQRLDNQTVGTRTGLSSSAINTTKGFYLQNIGMEASGVNGVLAKTDIGMRASFGEIVADNDLKRLVIGDAPTLATCTHIEVQRHSSWASGSVDFVVNQGSFSSLSGKYLFAVDSGFSEVAGVAL